MQQLSAHQVAALWGHHYQAALLCWKILSPSALYALVRSGVGVVHRR